MPTVVNDIHSQLNQTFVSRIVTPQSETQLQAEIVRARDEGRSVSVAGGRHSMGGQQFLSGGILIDMSSMHRILNLDVDLGLVEVEAGIQ